MKGLTTCHVTIGWAHPGRVLLLESVPLRLNDPRVLRGAWDAIRTSPGITGCDLVSSTGTPYFVVSVSDRPLEDPALEHLRLRPADLHGGSVQFSIVWAQDGGIKTALVDLKLEII
jgi:hypothetical protein